MRVTFHTIMIGTRDILCSFIAGWAVLFVDTLFDLHPERLDFFFLIMFMSVFFFSLRRSCVFMLSLLFIWSQYRGIDILSASLITVLWYVVFASLKRHVFNERTFWSFAALLIITTVVFRSTLIIRIVNRSWGYPQYAGEILGRFGYDLLLMIVLHCIIGVIAYNVIRIIQQQRRQFFLPSHHLHTL